MCEPGRKYVNLPALDIVFFNYLVNHQVFHNFVFKERKWDSEGIVTFF